MLNELYYLRAVTIAAHSTNSSPKFEKEKGHQKGYEHKAHVAAHSTNSSPKLEKEKGLQKEYEHRAHAAAHSTNSSPSDVVNFSTTSVALLNDFSVYLQEKGVPILSTS